MKRTIKYSCLIVLFLVESMYSYSQKENNKLIGVWEIFESISDISDTGLNGLFWLIGDSTIQTLISFTDGLFPEPFGSISDYWIEKNILTFKDEKGTYTCEIQFLQDDLFTCKYSDDEEDTILYLKKIK